MKIDIFEKNWKTSSATSWIVLDSSILTRSINSESKSIVETNKILHTNKEEFYKKFYKKKNFLMKPSISSMLFSLQYSDTDFITF